MDTKLENIWDLKPDGEDVSRGAGNAGLVGGELALSWRRRKGQGTKKPHGTFCNFHIYVPRLNVRADLQ